MNRLTARGIASITSPGRHSDGGNLYFVVDKRGGRRWTFIFRARGTGRLREMGLGSFANVSLSEARDAATVARRQLSRGLDPIDARVGSRGENGRDDATFGAFAQEFVRSIESGFRNEKHRAQWRTSFGTYAASLAKMPIADVGTQEVLKVLKPIWHSKPETATRLRGRIERVLDAATVAGLRKGENPARWRGHLAALLPPTNKTLRREHHASMPFEDLPAFFVKLRNRTALAARALEFTILTAARTGEVLGVTWHEIDFERALWTIPKHRMKAGREHVVPLTDPVIALLQGLRRSGNDGVSYVFAGERINKPLSQMAMAMLLRRLEVGFTVHGFRSSFRDWAGDMTDAPREIAEAALAHTIGSATEVAYRRRTAIEKRRDLMVRWAQYCLQLPPDRNASEG